MLDGQGADEILGGYMGYVAAAGSDLLRRRRLLRYARFSRAYRRRYGSAHAGSREIASAVVPAAVKAALGTVRRSAARHATALGGGGCSAAPCSTAPTLGPDPAEAGLRDLLLGDTQRLSLPALLRYEDRNSMAHSIEARVPFLDHRVVEFVFGLPDDWKIREASTKFVLREALRGVIPEGVRTRVDKIGFRADPGLTWRAIEAQRDDLAANRTAYEAEWFDAGAVREFLSTGGRSIESEFLAWRIFNVKHWLRATWAGGPE